MRLRYIRGAEDAVATSLFVIHEPSSFRMEWKERLCHERPLCLEIGTGRGQFLMQLAELHPENYYVGIEKYASVLVKALEKQAASGLENLCFLHMKAEAITEVFGPGEVDRIYLNFSDPWPKVRHAKHRLTSDRFLARYAQILKQEGVVELKTDNMGLYDFTLESLQAAGWTVLDQTRDLHHDPVRLAGNILTEYELRFLRQNKPIGKIIFRQ